MAQLFTTGPAHFFVGVNSSAISTNAGSQNQAAARTQVTYFYLGTAEAKPRIEVRRGVKPVFNDIRGQEIPFDLMRTGKEAIVVADINRLNYPVYRTLDKLPSAGIDPGTELAGDPGTLMLTEGRNLTLVVQFPYAAKPAYRTGGLPAGYRFPGAVFLGPDQMEIGTTPLKIQMIWHCIPLYSPKTQSHLLFDANMAGLPAID